MLVYWVLAKALERAPVVPGYELFIRAAQQRETPPPPPLPETDSSLFQAEGAPWKFGGRKGPTSKSVDAL